MRSDNHTNRPFNSNPTMYITEGMIAQVAQGHAADESISAEEEGEFVSVMIFSLDACTE